MALKKLDFEKLVEENTEPSKFRIPDGTIVSCEDCSWSGPIEDCALELESDGWESSSYTVLTCPKCSGDINV